MCFAFFIKKNSAVGFLGHGSAQSKLSSPAQPPLLHFSYLGDVKKVLPAQLHIDDHQQNAEHRPQNAAVSDAHPGVQPLRPDLVHHLYRRLVNGHTVAKNSQKKKIKECEFCYVICYVLPKITTAQSLSVTSKRFTYNISTVPFAFLRFL